MKLFIQIIACAGFYSVHMASLAQQPDDVLAEQQSYQDSASASQIRVEQMDDETLSMLVTYNQEVSRYEELAAYNANMRELIASQELEKIRLSQELEEVVVVQEALVPLMLEMVDVLERFIDLDKPILSEERRSRLDSLQKVIVRSDVELAEKYRRVIEAYQIEAEYGQSIEAYESQIELNGSELTVDLLRVGRAALYFVSLNRDRAGIWDERLQQWQLLSSADVEKVDYAIRVAREQVPPNLMHLPMWTGGVTP